MDAVRVTERGAGGSGMSGAFFGYIVALLLYMMIVIYGQSILRGVTEEKSTRVAEVVVASAPPETLLAGKTTQAAWRSKPSYYAVSTEDRTINPDLERFMAKRMGAKTIEVKASHLSLISHPEEITRLILEAAGQQT